MTSHTEWRRLSSISIVFFLTKSIGRFLKDSLPGLAPLAVVVFNSENKVFMTGLIGAGLVLFLIIFALLQYWFFRYKVESDKILINEGVFKKQQRSILFNKIQNINLLQPFYFKPFDLATLQIETAGSSSNEANLAGLSIEKAESIKAHALLTNQQTLENVEPSEELQQDRQEQLLAFADTLSLVKYGMTNNGMFWFFVFLAPVFGMIDDVIDKWIGKQNIEDAVMFFGDGVSGGLALATISIVMVVFLMFLFSILGAIFRYHDYHLFQTHDTLMRKSGLLNSHEETAKHSKIQAVIRQTNFIGHWLGVENLILKQASGQQQQSANRNLFVIPSRTPKESFELKSHVFCCESESIELLPINRRYLFKTWFSSMLIPVALAVILGYQHDFFWLITLLPVGIVFFLLIRRRWHQYGYGIGQQFAIFRRGLFGYNQIEFPIYKAQRVVIKQSPFQRRRHLATLKVYLASDSINIPYIPMEHAEEWFDLINQKIELSRESWF